MTDGGSRREFIKGAGVATAGLLTALNSGAEGAPIRVAPSRGGPERELPDTRPNFLIIMVDEERYPPGYENAQIQAWRKTNLPGQELLRTHGVEFQRHYTGSTACVPARNTFYTGQYPSLHGVTQTDGAAKGPAEPDMFWLDPSTVPTMGDYFRAAGYQTYYKGKWHMSEADILIPGSKTGLNSYTSDGTRDPAAEQLYLDADRLDDFGFSGYIGPVPHGQDPRNSGGSSASGPSGRDVAYADWTIDLLAQLDQGSQPQAPWLIVCSFVNPHDIVLYGFFGSRAPGFDFTIDPSVPSIPRSPSDGESLATKPICQASYRRTYTQAFQPTFNTETYRQLYYQLQQDVDAQVLRVFQQLQRTRFYSNTIVIYVSDHGELLGSHGGLFQKWHNAYEETIHVPLIVHNPGLFPERRTVDMPTSHVDVLPTMLGLIAANTEALRTTLAEDHTDVRPFVGRNLAPLVNGMGTVERPGEPIYFMTDDEPTSGSNQVNFTGFTYNSVIQPNHVETVVATLPTPGGPQVWKYSRYFDNPEFWSTPCTSDQVRPEIGGPLSICEAITKTQPVPDQFELYNLTDDPYEMTNLAFPANQTPASEQARGILAQILENQRAQKRLSPTSGVPQGIPACPVS